MSLASDRIADGTIGLGRLFTSAGVDPYDEIVWERRDARITNWIDGSVAFEQLDVEFPTSWSLNATNIVAQKYFRGTLGTTEREWSLKQVVDRIVDTITDWGIADGYFDGDEAAAFRDELKYILVTQRAAFNSPVWFNIGVRGVPQQASACFILAVDDEMPSILNWYREEGLIFKGGSGAGVNLSRIRSSFEPLEGGGTASGPVSFMRGADASAGTIKSGGKTRRAAKMVILDADHPDIEQFVWAKAIEERKARVLADAGFDMGLDGADSFSVQYQNANNSVRVTDEFMQAVLDDADWDLKAVTTGEVLRTVKARTLWREIAEAAWECADPGLQFDTTINRWHTAPNHGRITASNPCAEYLHVENSALTAFKDDVETKIVRWSNANDIGIHLVLLSQGFNPEDFLVIVTQWAVRVNRAGQLFWTDAHALGAQPWMKTDGHGQGPARAIFRFDQHAKRPSRFSATSKVFCIQAPLLSATCRRTQWNLRPRSTAPPRPPAPRGTRPRPTAGRRRCRPSRPPRSARCARARGRR